MIVLESATVHVVANSLHLNTVSDEAASALAPDVEYRIREIIQDAHKFARHSKRGTITTEDVNQALRLRNSEPLFGFGGKDPARFLRVAGLQDLFYLQDPVLEFDEVIDRPLPRCPVEAGVVPHWLVVQGMQPAIPENAALQPRRSKRQKTAAAAQPVSTVSRGQAIKQQSAGEVQQEAYVRAPVKHLLSQELQLYFERIARMLRTGGRAYEESVQASSSMQPDKHAVQQQMQQAMLHSLAEDPGLQALVPYFSQLIAEEVKVNLMKLTHLHLLLQAVGSLMANPHVQLEHYLQQLMPPVLTCLIGKRLGASAASDHWALRDKAARLVARICLRYGKAYHQLQPRVVRMLASAWRDAKNPLTTHYGAIGGLAALGHQTIRQTLLPSLPAYLALLEPQMQQASLALRRAEAFRCHGMLLQAAGMAMHHCLRQLLEDRMEQVQQQQPEIEDAEAEQDARSTEQPALLVQDGKLHQLEATLQQADARQRPQALQHAQQHGKLQYVEVTSQPANPKQWPKASQQAKQDGERLRPSNHLGHSLPQQGQRARQQRPPAMWRDGLLMWQATPPSAIIPQQTPLHTLLSSADTSANMSAPGALSRALSSAWSPEGSLGQQLTALHQLFGDALLPFLPNKLL